MKKGSVLAAAVALAAGLMLFAAVPGAQAPVEERPLAQESRAPSHEASSSEGERVGADATVTQTMRFSRCGHSVTRRVNVPSSVAGADFASAQGHYDLWQIETFSPQALVMSREIDLFCPMHWVLYGNEAGEIVLGRNLYGDGMAIEKTYDRLVEEMDEETAESLREGIGFDRAEEAEAWLGAH